MKTWNGPSKTDQYFAAKANAPSEPGMSPDVIKTVSSYRRGVLNDEHGNKHSQGTTPAGNVIGASGLSKKGNYDGAASSGGGGYRGGGGTLRQGPEVYSPLWLNSNLNMPRDRATINAWCRSFYALNPFVHNAINLHSTYPISKLNIKCPNKEIEKFFNDMIEELDLMNICVQIAQEYWLLGEAFVYADLDESKGKWSRLLIQNPDYMIVKRTVVADEPIIMLRPDANLEKIVFSNNPGDVEQRKQLSQQIIDSIKKGQNIPLDNMNIHHLTRKISPYEIRGTGLPVCIFRQLMLFDKLRESKFVQADGMINPTTVVKIGSENYKPTPEDLEAWRQTFANAQYDKDFKIFTHEGVTIERIGWGGGIYSIDADITQLIKEIYVGLHVSPVLMDGGSDISYSNGGIALDVLRQRYMQFRNMMSTWLKRKIFAPISKIQGFYEFVNGEKQLIVPEISWNHMSLFDTNEYIQNLVNLSTGPADQKRASLHSLYHSMGLEYEDEMRKIKKEAVQQTIFLKEKIALDAMSLNDLRALDENDEIQEPVTPTGEPVKQEPLPGEVPGGGMGGLPGLDMGSPPPPSGGGAPPPPEAPPASPPPTT